MKFFLFLLFFNNGRKNNFRNVTIFISYPMYFGALRTNINSKNQKSIIKWSFWPQNWAFPLNLKITGGFGAKRPILRPKWPLNDTFSIFWVDIRSQRIEIHRIRYKNRHISKIFFWIFIYFLATSNAFWQSILIF